MPKVYVIGGPNGAGKSTTAWKLASGFQDCTNTSTQTRSHAACRHSNPKVVAIEAGRLMLKN